MPSPTQIDIFGSDWEAAPDALQLVCVMSEAGTREQVSKPIMSKRTRKQYQMLASVPSGMNSPESSQKLCAVSVPEHVWLLHTAAPGAAGEVPTLPPISAYGHC